MSYEIQTKQIDLGDGEYAIFYQETRHGTQKAVNVLTRPFLKYAKTPKLTLVGDGEEKDLKLKGIGAGKVDINLAKVDWDMVNDIIIVGQVKEWSYGSVNQKTLDDLPERIRGRLVQECNELYGKPAPLPNGGGGK